MKSQHVILISITSVIVQVYQKNYMYPEPKLSITYTIRNYLPFFINQKQSRGKTTKNDQADPTSS